MLRLARSNFSQKVRYICTFHDLNSSIFDAPSLLIISLQWYISRFARHSVYFYRIVFASTPTFFHKTTTFWNLKRGKHLANLYLVTLVDFYLYVSQLEMQSVLKLGQQKKNLADLW